MSIFLKIQTQYNSVLKLPVTGSGSSCLECELKKQKWQHRDSEEQDTMASQHKPPFFFMWRGPLFKLLPPSWLTPERREAKAPRVF